AVRNTLHCRRFFGLNRQGSRMIRASLDRATFLVKPATGRRDRSAQLTILAAAPVVSAELIHVAVFGFLARHTEADSGHRLAARLRNLRAAFLTVRQPGPA